MLGEELAHPGDDAFVRVLHDVMTGIREEQKAQEKALRPGYDLKPMRNCFVFPSLQKTIDFIREEVYKATENN